MKYNIEASYPSSETTATSQLFTVDIKLTVHQHAVPLAMLCSKYSKICMQNNNIIIAWALTILGWPRDPPGVQGTVVLLLLLCTHKLNTIMLIALGPPHHLCMRLQT